MTSTSATASTFELDTKADTTTPTSSSSSARETSDAPPPVSFHSCDRKVLQTFLHTVYIGECSPKHLRAALAASISAGKGELFHLDALEAFMQTIMTPDEMYGRD